jgi:hypothetical protein
LTTRGQLSTSPQPVMFASVEIFMMRASYELSVRLSMAGKRRYRASTSVIFMSIPRNA